ncbi:MAG: F0F1 ATP synthase subunit B [Rhodospirillales bacterium]|nr:F0F1 ATP synthase subunit B [Rhodospirillales bacterium]MCW9040522.1 F0F1 ATP synthase subunit B [Rhodospirillales bacterium]
MNAYAADAAHAAAHAEPFYHSTTFWVAVAFVLFMLLAGKKIYLLAGTALDDRAETIRARLDEAQKLREEAQAILATNQRKQRDAIKEAEMIVTRAKEEAERIRERAVAELEGSMKRREQMALDRIAQAETRAIKEVKSMAADIAIEATRRVLVDNMTDDKATALIDTAIKELGDKLH